MLSDHLARLRKRMLDEAALTDRMRHDAEEQEAFAEICRKAKADHADPLREKVGRLELFAAEMPLNSRPGDRLFGSQRFTNPPDRPVSGNHGHIIPNFPRLLRDGVSGTRRKIAAMEDGTAKEAFGRALEAFARFIRRHAGLPGAEWVANLAEAPPRDWREALQLIWFAMIFLHAEGCSAAFSLGRFDEYMLPFWQGDPEANEELLGEFLIKFTEGEESQNLTLSGRDANPVFFAVLKQMAETRSWQPSVSVLIGDAWSERQYEAVTELIAAGTGQPACFSQATLRRALSTLAEESAAAGRWGIVGCYEAAPAGNCYPLTVACQQALNGWFAEFFRQEEAEQVDFEGFYRAWRGWLERHCRQTFLPECARRWQALRGAPSPFLSVLVDGCMESGRFLEEGGAQVNLFGLNIMGLGTVIDSLMAVKTLVYEKNEYTLAELRQAVRDNFPDETMRLRCAGLPGKYGSDRPDSNALAADLSRFLSETFNARRLAGTPALTSLGLFWFSGDIYAQTPATPDGRRDGDPVSYGVGPGQFLGEYQLTSILNSARTLAHDGCPNGNPLQFRLNAADVAAAEGRRALAGLVKGYFTGGGFHLQFNLVSPAELADAQRYPEKHRDLTVRVSGYSTLFNGVERHWQDRLIERAESGI